MSLFSVIVPTFNRAALLREALDSIFAQEFSDFEVIIVDGGSTDETPSVLAEYGPKVRVIEERTVRGPGAARNAGCRHATGEYLTFLDCDDLWFPWTLATYAEVLRRENQPTSIMGTAIEFEDENVVAGIGREPLRCRRFDDYLSSSRWPIWTPGCCMAIQRKAFEKISGFTNECIGGEDSDLALRLGALPGFVHVAAPFALGYRLHAQNTVKIFERSIDGLRFQIRNEREGRYPGGAPRARERWNILTRHIRPVAKACLRNRKRAEAWEFYRASFKWHVAVRHWKYLLGFPVTALVS